MRLAKASRAGKELERKYRITDLRGANVKVCEVIINQFIHRATGKSIH
jgi:hypothetical protein